MGDWGKVVMRGSTCGADILKALAVKASEPDMRQLPMPCTPEEANEWWRRRTAAREGRTYYK